MTRWSALLLVVGVVWIGGCATTTHKLSSSYETVAEDPHRNSEAAEREHARAIKLIEEGKPEEAEKALKAALTLDIMHGPAHNNLGKLYFDQGKLYLAAWEFQYAVRLMPDHPEPKNNLGLVFETVGKLDDAVSAYADARKIAPDSVQTTANLARARVKRGDKDEETRKLLSDVIDKDDRPEWRDWARERLVLMHNAPATNHDAPTTRP